MSETPQDKVLVLDLTLEEPCPEHEKPTKQIKSISTLTNIVGRLSNHGWMVQWRRLQLKRGEEGFLAGRFTDGTTVVPEVPSVCYELPTTPFLSQGKKRSGGNIQLGKVEKNTKINHTIRQGEKLKKSARPKQKAKQVEGAKPRQEIIPNR